MLIGIKHLMCIISQTVGVYMVIIQYQQNQPYPRGDHWTKLCLTDHCKNIPRQILAWIGHRVSQLPYFATQTKSESTFGKWIYSSSCFSERGYNPLHALLFIHELT